MGLSQYVGTAIQANGRQQADEIIARTSCKYRASGAIPHADAGYHTGRERAVEYGPNLLVVDIVTP